MDSDVTGLGGILGQASAMSAQEEAQEERCKILPQIKSPWSLGGTAILWHVPARPSSTLVTQPHGPRRGWALSTPTPSLLQLALPKMDHLHSLAGQILLAPQGSRSRVSAKPSSAPWLDLTLPPLSSPSLAQALKKNVLFKAAASEIRAGRGHVSFRSASSAAGSCPERLPKGRESSARLPSVSRWYAPLPRGPRGPPAVLGGR